MQKNKKRQKQTNPNKTKRSPGGGLEDIAEIIGVAEMITRHINQFEIIMAEEIHKLEIHIKKLEKEIDILTKRIKI